MPDDRSVSLSAVNREYLRILQDLAAFNAPWSLCEDALFSIAEQMPRNEQFRAIEDYVREHPVPVEERYPAPGWLHRLFRRLSSDIDESSFLFTILMGLCARLEFFTQDGLPEAIAIAEEVERFISSYSTSGLSDRDCKMIKKIESRYRNAFNLMLEQMYEQDGQLEARDRVRSRIDHGVTFESLAYGVAQDAINSLTGTGGQTGKVEAATTGKRKGAPEVLKGTALGYWFEGSDHDDFEVANPFYRKALELMEASISFSPEDSEQKGKLYELSGGQINRLVELCIRYGYFSDAQRWMVLQEIKAESEKPHPELVDFLKFENTRILASIATGLRKLPEAKTLYVKAVDQVKMGSTREILCWFDYVILLEYLDENDDKQLFLDKIRNHEKAAETLLETVDLMFSTSTNNLHRSPLSGSCSFSLFENKFDWAALWLDEARNIMKMREEEKVFSRRVYFLRTCAVVYDGVGRGRESCEFLDAAVCALEQDMSMLSRLPEDRIEFLEVLLSVAKNQGSEKQLNILNEMIARVRSQLA